LSLRRLVTFFGILIILGLNPRVLRFIRECDINLCDPLQRFLYFLFGEAMHLLGLFIDGRHRTREFFIYDIFNRHDAVI